MTKFFKWPRSWQFTRCKPAFRHFNYLYFLSFSSRLERMFICRTAAACSCSLGLALVPRRSVTRFRNGVTLIWSAVTSKETVLHFQCRLKNDSFIWINLVYIYSYIYFLYEHTFRFNKIYNFFILFEQIFF